MKVNVPHRPGVKRSYRVNGLSKDSAENTFFEDDEGQRMPIVQYFQRAYNIHLSYPELPCLHVGARRRTICLWRSATFRLDRSHRQAGG